VLQVIITVARVCTRQYKSTICKCNMQLVIQRSVQEKLSTTSSAP